ncbi:pyridoxal-phosphate dependent enzyme [Lacticaseibacillus daqingensis]|uniref:pyridoxal-phosphate dependent enzyme n=1 Tax=Lacticaseibacillus daqingensis TaxID=2486014 RepID=UPI000F791A41|nr:pyridoxal-phosphate dependent enzyme [Lacticaseibacillus daqingensis]
MIMQLDSHPVALADLRAAQHRLAPHARTTPLVPSRVLSAASGGEVFLKLENLQLTGSFKFRGAYNRIATLPKPLQRRGVITVSAGNHAQGVALTAKLLGLSATVVMPLAAPKSKQAATCGYGARVQLIGETFDAARAAMLEQAAVRGLTVVDPYDDPQVIAGQGTVGLEVLAALPAIDTLLVPVGGGGLIAGIALAAKALSPRTRIVGVQSANVHGMAASLAAGRMVTHRKAATLADGTAVATPGVQPFALVRELVADIVVVSEEEIQHAMCVLLQRHKVVAEGAGALTTAALLNNKLPAAWRVNQRVAAIVSGGNVDLGVLAGLCATR